MREASVNRQIFAERDRLHAEADDLSVKKIEREFAALSQGQNREMIKTTANTQKTLMAEALTNEMQKMFIERVDVYRGMRVAIRYRFGDLFQIT